jgi:hypothetical protein
LPRRLLQERLPAQLRLRASILSLTWLPRL